MQQASNLADESRAQSGRVQAVVGLPVVGTTHCPPSTSTGTIQRAPRRVQNKRKRGGVAHDGIIQLLLVGSRAPLAGDKSCAPSNIQREQPNA